MIEVLVGNDIEQAIKVFTNRTKKSGILGELRLREFYESPSERKRRKRADNVKRTRRREIAVEMSREFLSRTKRKTQQDFARERRAESLSQSTPIESDVMEYVSNINGMAAKIPQVLFLN